MFEKLEQLRKLPDETKRWIALGGAAGISGIIFMFWVVSLSVTLNSSQSAFATNTDGSAGSGQTGAATAAGVSPLAALEANVGAAVAPLGSAFHNFASYFSSATTTATTTIAPTAPTIPTAPMPASPAMPLATTSLGIDHLLKPGDIEPQVVLLQKALAGQGFYNGPLNGKLGPLTDAALIRFQTAYNIVPAHSPGSGQVGPKTRAAINQLLLQ